MLLDPGLEMPLSLAVLLALTLYLIEEVICRGSGLSRVAAATADVMKESCASGCFAKSEKLPI